VTEWTGISRKRIFAARAIAGLADFLQIVAFPFFIEGAASPFDIAVDVIVGALMCWLVGWHIAFVPAFLAEVLPVIDLAPTWTIAVFIATRGKVVEKPTDDGLLPPLT